jgi:hypothetical protein
MNLTHKLTLLAISLSFGCLNAQVGIGTLSPSAELEVEGTNTGIPTLELNPQSAPVGSATGQLAVIGDKLYLYDDTRGKWLSVEATALSFGSSGSTSNAPLRYGGDVLNLNSGAQMPFNGTIVYVSATSSTGFATKGMEVRVKNGTTIQSTIAFNLVANKFSKTDYNVNFNAGDYINTFVVNAGGFVGDPTVTVWVKWRE